MNVERVSKNWRWLSAFFVVIVGLASYYAFALYRGAAMDSLEALGQAELALVVGYTVFLCLLAKDLGENRAIWVIAVFVFVPIGFLYSYPRMSLTVSQAKKRLNSSRANGTEVVNSNNGGGA
jgi:hypothetical protein